MGIEDPGGLVDDGGDCELALRTVAEVGADSGGTWIGSLASGPELADLAGTESVG